MQRWQKLMISGYYMLVVSFPFLAFGGAALPRQIVQCDGVNCTFCDLATLAQNVINTGVFLFVFLAAMMFSFAGFKMLTSAESPGQRDKAKDILTGTAMGLILLLAAWLIVDTLMKSVLGGSFGPWNNVCQFLTP